MPTFQAPQAPDPRPRADLPAASAPASSGLPGAPAAARLAGARPAIGAPEARVVDVILVVAAVFAVGGVGFALGRATAPAATIAQTGARGNGPFGNGAVRQRRNGGQFPNGGEFPNGGQFGGGQGGNGGAGGFGRGLGITLSGQVTDISADHLTLKLASGQSIQIGLNSTTTYHTQTPATAGDVTTGSTVQVQVTRAAAAAGTGTRSAPATAGPRAARRRLERDGRPEVTRGSCSAARRRSSSDAPRPSSVPAMHVLVVEDDPRLGRLLRRLLEDERHVVELATDGRSALELAEEVGGLDAIVLDVGLPDISGLEVARRLRATGSTVADPHADRPRHGRSTG